MGLRSYHNSTLQFLLLLVCSGNVRKFIAWLPKIIETPEVYGNFPT